MRIEQGGGKVSHRSFAALSDMGMIFGAIHQVACARRRRRLPNIEREGG